MKIILKGYKVTEFHVINDMRPGEGQQTDMNFKYNVSYTPNRQCRSEMKVRINGKDDPSKLSMHMTITGNFEMSENEYDRELAHIETFKILFPIARATVAAMTAAAGMPPMNLPFVDIESQNIYRMNFKMPDGKTPLEDR